MCLTYTNARRIKNFNQATCWTKKCYKICSTHDCYESAACCLSRATKPYPRRLSYHQLAFSTPRDVVHLRVFSTPTILSSLVEAKSPWLLLEVIYVTVDAAFHIKKVCWSSKKLLDLVSHQGLRNRKSTKMPPINLNSRQSTCRYIQLTPRHPLAAVLPHFHFSKLARSSSSLVPSP